MSGITSALNQVKPNRWMLVLLSMASASARIDLRSSILAASLALYGKRTQDSCCELEARRWYGLGLQHLRAKLLGADSPDKPSPSAEDIHMAIMLAYYEVTSSTSITGYFQHVLGAGALLEHLGPQRCQKAPFHQLFQTVRLHMVRDPIFPGRIPPAARLRGLCLFLPGICIDDDSVAIVLCCGGVDDHSISHQDEINI